MSAIPVTARIPLASFLLQRVRRLVELRTLITRLVLHDLQTQFAGSLFGSIWAIVHPFVMALVLWYVFTFGIRSAPIEDVPFHVWLFCGLFPWTAFSTSLSGSCTSLLEQSYLVKQPDFCVALIPIVRVLSTALIHLAFLLILFGFALAAGIHPSLSWLQFLYYTPALILLCIGFGWLLSALQLFLRDTAQFISVLLQLGFWLTPIFWNPSQMPEVFTRYLAFSPIATLVDGYRNALFGTSFFWQNPTLQIVFWIETLVLFFGGLAVFRRLRPHFLDLL